VGIQVRMGNWGEGRGWLVIVYFLSDVPACFGGLYRRFGPGGWGMAGVSFVIKFFIYTILREIDFYTGEIEIFGLEEIV
jgi:hypothetical protein